MNWVGIEAKTGTKELAIVGGETYDGSKEIKRKSRQLLPVNNR
ncbi:Uncharacterised protein [uncultured archaeon]|nr:Uncharacterised protein [uncultured archaeon]